jgi:GxxExxY protein
MESGLIYPEESYAIIGACLEVYKDKGCGFLEPVYQECLEIEFQHRRIPYVAQRVLTLTYRGRLLQQTYKPDFVCYDKIILELKAVTRLTDEHRAQTMNYLKATGYQLALLVNFGHYPLLEKVRVANTKGRLTAEHAEDAK